MCAINGVFAYHYAANPVDAAEIVVTRDHMKARGPDGCGLWVAPNERVGFGHRRLAIIDLSEDAAQPMASVDGRFIITFNGEIYNYSELRLELEGRGCAFKSQSDTEVLLHLYARRGADMVHDLRGMFALAIWDDLKGELFLARDPYGIKPLYYADDWWTFRFASQVKALLAGGALSRDPEPAGLVGFYLWGSVPEPFTNYRAIRALPAGATLTVSRAGAGAVHRYHSIAQVYVDAEFTAGQRRAVGPSEYQEEVRQALLDSVRHHLVSDVPVGAFLSAGVDSGALVGLMRDAGQQRISTVTLAFEEFRGHADDEAPLAAEVARQYGTYHSTRIVTRSEFEADLPNLLNAMDQPSIDGINTWFVSKAAKELGLKVAISGLGGDELFGGYPSFKDIPKCVRMMQWPSRVPLLGLTARAVGRPLAKWLGLNPKAAGVLELGGSYAGAYLLRRGLFMPWELDTFMDRDVMRRGLRSLDAIGGVREQLRPTPASAHDKVATLEATLYMRNQLLRDTDWASMAHSLEVRTPLVDATLIKRIAALGQPQPSASAKQELALAPSMPLPNNILRRKKTGFGTPLARWLPAAGGSSASVSTYSYARAWAQHVARC